MTYHRKNGLGQTAPDMVFSITDPDVAAAQGLTVTGSTSTASTGTKSPASSSGGGKTTSTYPSTVAPSSSLITSAAYSSTPTDATPHWLPWALGGGVALIGLALVVVARR